MEIKEVQEFLEPQFGFLAKSNGEQLWMHHFTVWKVFKELVKFIPSFTESDKEILEIACLIHDIAKRNELNQRILIGEETGKVRHKPTFDEVRLYIEQSSLPFHLSEKDIKKIYDIVLTHHSVSEDDIKEIDTISAGTFTDVLRFSDWLASMESISPQTINKIRDVTNGLFELTFFEISRFPSPSTYFFLDRIIKVYKEEEWTPLLVFDNGALFIRGTAIQTPEKERIIEAVLDQFFSESLKRQSPYKPNFTKSFLGGLSELFPHQFLKIHEQEIKDNLGDIDRKGIQFFRLLFDIVSLKKGEINRLRKELRIWNLIPSCLGPSGHPKAKRLWSEYFNEHQESIDSKAINKLLSKIKLSDIVPKDYPQSPHIEYNTYLVKISYNDLFDVLLKISEHIEKTVSETQELTVYLDQILAVEEAKNFRKVALELFEKYKIYKKTTDANKGICERCGCPISMEAKPSLNYPRGGGYGFSQIKANPKNARATCPFCAFDTMFLREDLGGNDLNVFVRIESKIPDLASIYPELKNFIIKLENGISTPRDILKLEEREELRNLPFSKRISVPISASDKDGHIEEMLNVERGALFKIDKLKGKKAKNFSPKDYRAKYKPLYHALNLLGFQTNIGTEEQEGIFGEKIITTEDEYFKSLAVVLLANVLYDDPNKGQKKFIFAENLLDKSPSVAVKFAAELRAKSKNLRMREKLSGRFFEFLYRSEINLFKLNGGEYSMRNLIEDAAFFADKEWGIPHFCIEPEDRGDFWMNLTRHKAAKPVSAALNEMLQSSEDNSYQRAIASFMRNLAKKIPSEEKEKQNEFMKNTTEILGKYWELRKEDISRFIRDKNALTSTIFVFTRYPNLKEVIKNE